MPYCRNCGKKLGEYERCGCQSSMPRRIIQPQPLAPKVQTSAPPKMKKSAMVFIVVISVIIGTVVTILSEAYFFGGIRHEVLPRGIDKKASDLYDASVAAVKELDVQGTDLSGYHIVTSKHEYYEADFAKEFCKLVQKQDSGLKRKEYFVVIKNGRCVYAAISRKWNDSPVGTYAYSSTGAFYVFDSTSGKSDLESCLNSVRSNTAKYWSG